MPPGGGVTKESIMYIKLLSLAAIGVALLIITVSAISGFIAASLFCRLLGSQDDPPGATVKAPSPYKASEVKSASVQVTGQPVTKISFPKLAKAYSENHPRADRDYKGKQVEVTGFVVQVTNDYVQIHYCGPIEPSRRQKKQLTREELGGFIADGFLACLTTAHCYFGDRNLLAPLDNGAVITVRGICDGKYGSAQWPLPGSAIAIRDCQLVKSELYQGWQDAFKNADEAQFKSPLPLTPDQKVEIDGMRFELLEGKVGKLRLSTQSSFGGDYVTDSPKEYFSIKFRITNATDHYVFHFRRLDDLYASPITIKDEFGNTYAIRHIPFMTYIEGGSKDSDVRVDPGQFIVDIMAFELPIPKAQSFTLEVPAHSFGRKGSAFAYTLPRAWFK
jgi:hypothetical protein